MRASALLIALAALALAGCSSGAREHTDPQGRIAFQVPADWTEARASNGTRFEPPGPRPKGAHIQVNTVPVHARLSLEEERDGWLQQQERLGEEEVPVRGGTRVEGWDAVEYAHTVESTAGDGVQHFVTLQRGDVKVATWLMATHESYETHLPAFREVVRSIRQTAGN